MESEYYFDPVRRQVMVNVTDVFDADLRKLLAEVGEEFSWVGGEFTTVADGNDVSQWMLLHEATELHR